MLLIELRPRASKQNSSAACSPTLPWTQPLQVGLVSAEQWRNACRSQALSLIVHRVAAVNVCLLSARNKKRQSCGALSRWLWFHYHLAWLPLQSLAVKKRLFFVQILGSEKLLKFVEKCRWKTFKRPERGLTFFKHVSDRFSDLFSRFSNRFSCQIKNFSGAVSFCRHAALTIIVEKNSAWICLWSYLVNVHLLAQWGPKGDYSELSLLIRNVQCAPPAGGQCPLKHGRGWSWCTGDVVQGGCGCIFESHWEGPFSFCAMPLCLCHAHVACVDTIRQGAVTTMNWPNLGMEARSLVMLAMMMSLGGLLSNRIFSTSSSLGGSLL